MNSSAIPKFRLRPSVSFVPTPENEKYQFFISDIRQSFNMMFADHVLVKILSELDGSRTTDQLEKDYSLDSKQKLGLERLFEILINKCVIEDSETIGDREASPFRRVLNFIASYVPYYEVDSAFEKLTKSQAVIIGTGGVGSWVVLLLSQMGIKNYVLIDDDIVKPHNLNRSVFTKSDIGAYKTDAISRMLSAKKKDYYTTTSILSKIDSAKTLTANLKDIITPQTVLINCADYPSASQTSAIINDVAFKYNLPYIIAGGYNMHLSLIGPTIIPHETPCFHCISHGMEQLNPAEMENAERIVKEHRNIGNVAPLAAISASFVANEYLKLSLGRPNLRPSMIGKRGEFNFFTKKISTEQYEKWDECPFCSQRQ